MGSGRTVPAASAAANFSGSMAPSRNMTIGILFLSRPKTPKSSLATIGGSSKTFFGPSAFFSRAVSAKLQEAV